jgi:hypothetical protein
MPGDQRARSHRVTSPRRGGVAPLARSTGATVRRGASCRHAVATVTRLMVKRETGSYHVTRKGVAKAA